MIVQDVSPAFLMLVSVMLMIALASPAVLPAQENLYSDLAVAGTGEGRGQARQSLREAFDSIPGGGSARVLLLTRNAGAWAARWWMMKRARQRIDTTYFIVDPDIFGMSFVGHLLVKGKQGCRIRFMLDTKGSLKLTTSGFGQDYLQELVDNAGAEVMIYSPALPSLAGQLKQTVVKIFRGRLPDSAAVAACNHDKILVVDGKNCMTGGRNIAHHYFAPFADAPDVFRDSDLYIESEKVAGRLMKGFAAEFYKKGNEKVKGEAFGPNIRRDIELTAAYIMMDEWLNAEPLVDSTVEKALKDEKTSAKLVLELEKAVIDRLPRLGFAGRKLTGRERKSMRRLAVELVGYPRLRGAGRIDPGAEAESVESVKIIDKGSSVNKIEDGIQAALLKMVRAAQTSIVIQNPYVLLTETAVKALAEAGSRGVKITIVTNSPVSTDSEITQGFFVEKWPKYLAAIPNLRIKVLTGGRKLHAKTAVFDEVLSMVGTYNLDYISARVNSEIIAVAWSQTLAGRLSHSILEDPSYVDALFEYTIKRDKDGRPVDKDPSTPGIEPVVEHGAKDHVPPQVWKHYKRVRFKTRLMEKILPQLKPLF